MTRGWRDGVTPEQLNAVASNTRRALRRILDGEAKTTVGESPRLDAVGQNVLAQASRSAYPGSVFALAALLGETDPLTDTESRLL
jgi:hypothetical protein